MIFPSCALDCAQILMRCCAAHSFEQACSPSFCIECSKIQERVLNSNWMNENLNCISLSPTTFQCKHECSWDVRPMMACAGQWLCPKKMVLTLAHGADFNLPAEMEVSLSRQRNVKVHWTLIECRANHWEVKPSRQTRRHSAMHYFINFPLRLRLADAQKGCRLMLCSGGDVQGSTESLSAALLSAATWRSISCAVFRAADLPGCQLLSSAAWNLIFCLHLNPCRTCTESVLESSSMPAAMLRSWLWI